MIYKLINNLIPLYLSELCLKYVEFRTNYDLRANGHLIVPFSRIKRFENSFLISCINFWNNLAICLKVFVLVLHLIVSKIMK
jgi:hypothetical protein